MNKFPQLDANGNPLILPLVNQTKALYTHTIYYSACPKCGVGPHFHCERPSGRMAWPPHKERVESFVFMTGK